MALGLCLIWGYGGTLSFGQTAFFGLAGYAYGVITINFGAAYGFTLRGGAAVAWCALRLFAAMLGYFMYLRTHQRRLPRHRHALGDAGLRTLHGADRRPGMADRSARLNGYNGMSGMPPLTLALVRRRASSCFRTSALYYLVLALLVPVYLGLRILVNSRFGNVLVAIRENPERAEMLGYDVRKYQLGAFVVGGALAGLSGTLYTAWGQYITPSSMSITAAALPIVWVAVGGRSDLTATLIGTLAVLAAFQALTIYRQPVCAGRDGPAAGHHGSDRAGGPDRRPVAGSSRAVRRGRSEPD